MKVTNSALRAELGHCLERLQDALGKFASHVQVRAHDAWVWQKPGKEAHALTLPPPDLSRERTLEVIAESVRTIKYTDQQAPHETRIVPGVIVVAEEGIELAEEVNRQKRALAAVLRAMQSRTEIGVVNQQTGERGPRPLREVALEAYFFRRLHHWQATRELVVLREQADEIGTPEYIGFSWATCRDVRRTWRESLLEQLEKSRATADDLEPYDRDLALVASLPAKEPLAIVRPGHTTPKANIAWPARDGAEPTRKIKPAVLPLVMLGQRLPERLRKLPPVPTPRHFRLARTDTEIEIRALLETIPVYRYLPHVVAEKRAELGNEPFEAEEA